MNLKEVIAEHHFITSPSAHDCCYDDCPACAQKKLKNWLEENWMFERTSGYHVFSMNLDRWKEMEEALE